MPISANTIRDRQSPSVKERAAALSQRLFSTFPFLAIRSALGLSQSQIADALGTSQANVCRQEARKDFLISTLSKFARATGGDWSLRLNYPDVKLDIRPHGETGEICVNRVERKSSLQTVHGAQVVDMRILVPIQRAMVAATAQPAGNDADYRLRHLNG